jgi:prepilin peptidase CpaA
LRWAGDFVARTGGGRDPASTNRWVWRVDGGFGGHWIARFEECGLVNSWLALSFVLSCGAAIVLVWAALHDLAARTVPNPLPLALLAIGFCARVMDHALLASLAVAALTFAGLFGIWLAGAIGGGDVKLWSASVMLVPAHWQIEFTCFTRILLAGGVLALLYLTLRLVVAKPGAMSGGRPPVRPLAARVLRAEAWRISRKAPLPYACAIAGGTLVTLLPASLAALR